MKKIIALCSTFVLSLVFVSVMATGPIMKAHKDNAKAKRADGKVWACGSCHNATANNIAKKKNLGLNPEYKNAKGEVQKEGANYAKTKANPACKECHK